MHHIKVIKDGNVNNVVKEQLVDGVQYVDNEPHEGSLNGITSDAVAKVAGDVGDVKDVIPEDTTEENPLVNETGLGEVAERVTTAEGDIDSIEEKIPSGASSSNKLVTESDLEAAQDNWKSGFTPKGEATVSQIDALTTQSNGDQYIVTDSGTITAGSVAVVAGDTVAWDSENAVWYKVTQYAKASEQATLTTYAQNVAHSIAPEFDPTRDSEHAYPAGYSVTYTDGKVYTFKINHYGPWDSSVVWKADDLNEIENSLARCLKDCKEIEYSAFSLDSHFDENGYIVSDSSGNFKTTNSVNIEGCDYLIVKLYQNVSIISPIRFTDSNGTFVGAVQSIDGSETGVARGVVSIPAGATRARFCMRVVDETRQYALLHYPGIQDKVLRIKEIEVAQDLGESEESTISQKSVTNALEGDKLAINRTFPMQGYLNSSGNIVADSSGNWKYSAVTKIPYGLNALDVRVYCLPTDIAMAVFYDNARNKLSVVTTTDGAVSRQVYEGKISVPSGACYVRCNWHKGSGGQYFGYKIENDVVAEKAITDKAITKCNIVAKPFTLSGGNAIGFGDSIMYGYRSLDPTDVSSSPWPNLVKDALGLNNFTNRAVGGAGFTTGTTILTQITGQTLNTRDLIFIAAGTNDFHYGASLSSFSSAVNAVFDYVDSNKGSQTKVVVVTPINRSQAPGVENGASLDVYRSILTELALERGYSVLDGSSFGFPQVESDYQAEVLNDGLHPTDKGYVIYANAVCGLLS